MSFNATNPVSVGAATKKDHYDRVFDNTLDLRTGGIAVTSQAVGDIFYATSAAQIGRLAAVASGQVLVSGASAPAWSATPVLTAVVLEAATTSGVRLDLESGVLAVREGDDSAYAGLKALTGEFTGNVTVLTLNTYTFNQSVASGAAPTFAGTNFTSIPDSALSSNVALLSDNESVGGTWTFGTGVINLVSGGADYIQATGGAVYIGAGSAARFSVHEASVRVHAGLVYLASDLDEYIQASAGSVVVGTDGALRFTVATAGISWGGGSTIASSNSVAVLADNETVSGSWTFTASTTVSGASAFAYMQAPSVSIPMTAIAPANTYGFFRHIDSGGGGLNVYGLSDTDQQALGLLGVIGASNPADTTPAIVAQAGKSNGSTSWQALDASETVFQVKNFSAALLNVLGDGDVGMLAAARLYFDGIAATGDTYMYEIFANQLRLVVGGVAAWDFLSTGAYTYRDFAVDATYKVRWDGSLAGDTYTYESAANTLVDVVGGVTTFERTAGAIKVLGTEGGAATLYLWADEGDDAADKWYWQANTSGQLVLDRGAGTTVLTMASDGTGDGLTNVTFSGVRTYSVAVGGGTSGGSFGVRNAGTASGNSTSFYVGNDTSSTMFSVVTYSSGYTTANLTEITQASASGLLVKATHASGKIQMIASSAGVELLAAATAWSAISDETMKTGLRPLTSAAQRLLSARTVTGRYIEDDDSVSRAFFFAQDWQAILPEAVSMRSDGVLSMRYTDTLPLIAAAVNEHTSEIETLRANLTAAQARIAELEARHAS